MQNDKICSDIVSALVRTRTEANLLQSEVDVLRRSLYIVGAGDYASTLENSVRAKTALALAQISDEKDREDILDSIKKKIDSLSYLGITIAFEPNLGTVAKLSIWVRRNVGEGIVLDISLDKSILGGAVIEYKGHIKSFTLITEVDNYFLTAFKKNVDGNSAHEL